jgi:hypothetical protein
MAMVSAFRVMFRLSSFGIQDVSFGMPMALVWRGAASEPHPMDGLTGKTFCLQGG